MARRKRRPVWRRMELPVGDFHVINRGARKLAIFADDADRSLFVQYLGRFALKHQIAIIAWCLMPNHFHLELRTAGAVMCRFMHDLQSAYARAFNKRHGTSGCVFQGRFRCFAIRTAEGLACVSRYIHANSRDLGIQPGDYRWSSCRSYLGKAWVPKWLDPSPVLAAIHRSGVPDKRAYQSFLAQVPPKRRSKRLDVDGVAEFEMERVRRLEERLMERRSRFPAEFAKIPFRLIVCWSARTLYNIPAEALADFFGYASARSVHTIVGRVEGRLRRVPDRASLLGGDLF